MASPKKRMILTVVLLSVIYYSCGHIMLFCRFMDERRGRASAGYRHAQYGDVGLPHKHG